MTIPNLSDDIYNSFPDEPPRAHMGLSLAGHECDRWLWLSFRWAVIQKFPGRIKRLFRRGQDEEAYMVEDLRRAGYTVTECLNDQTFIDCGCHVGGSPDGVISGLRESAKEHIWECKTHSKKSYNDLENNGVEKSKPMHFMQMQCYMYKRGLERALYTGVCKDDDNIYAERARLDKQLADKAIRRLQRIALEERLPVPNETFACKWCPAHDFCFGEMKPEVNCRTCAHATPTPEGTWHCERWNADIPVDGQREGCRSHVIHPDLIDAKIKQYDEWSVYYDGILVGEAGVTSREFLDMDVRAIASAFDGRVV